ncbi:MAG: flagellar basal-body MS-ring/collar protein FliF [Myxococcota bacterium]|nr:flagellar basal-body MS-ring/collar protein FliF [Myxococcota bacterium]
MDLDLQPLREQLTAFWAGLDLKRRVGLVAAIVLSAAAIVGVGIWASQAATVTVLAGDPQEVRSAAGALDQAGVAYQVEDEGTRLVVYESDIGAAGVAIASTGLQPGLEIIEALPVGSTSRQLDIAEKAQMERDLALSLSQLKPVKSAAVHLVLPEDNSFLVANKRPASASVVMQMAGGMTLSQKQLKGVVNLVAAAVPELQPEAVSVINQNGELLWDGDIAMGGGAEAGDEMTRKRRMIEQDLEEKVQRNLRAILPDPGSYSVSVRAELSYTASVGERKELLEGLALEERIEESKSYDGDNGAGGVAGADANTGTPENGGAAGLSETSKIQTSSTPGHNLTRTDTERGVLERVSVAVTVDSNKINEIAAGMAAEGEEPDVEAVRKQLQSLAVSSAGATGDLDSVEVIMLPFTEPKIEVTTGALVTQSLLPYLPYLIALLVVGLVFGMVVRPVMKQLLTRPPPEPEAEEEEEEEEEDDLATRLREMVDNYESVDREDLNKLAQREAEAAAQVIRLWATGSEG